MAAMDTNFEGIGRFTPEQGEYNVNMDESQMMASTANVLTLNEARTPSSGDQESEEGRPYPQYEDQGTVSDEGQELSPDGILDEETIGQGLSNLGRSADGTQQVYLHLTLPGYSLKDISILEDFVHLQKVELPYNEISDLCVLGAMPNLLELDASNNQLTELLDFNPPTNLKSVNLSFNQIQKMTDLSVHHYLSYLNLDNNNISELSGLLECHRLSHLSLAHNDIHCIQGLENLPIKHLDISSNQIKKIENISSLKYLQTLNLSRNHIRSLDGLQDHEFLETINVEDNEVIDLSEIQYVKSLRMLRELNLQRNPIQELPDYRLSILFHLQRLTVLDKHKVEVEEKVAATNMFNPPMEVIAARDHIMHVVYSFLQPSRILDSTLPSVETPYPMLVLVGPQGAGKKDLALKLVEEFPDFFGYGISHTTRKPQNEETNGKDYHFVSIDEFENEVKCGKFVQTYSYHGNLYGLTVDSVEAVAREGLACVVHMELEGVLTLKNTYHEPRYVLIIPLDREAHERRLRERGIYSEQQIEWSLDRAEVYAEHNRQHPGFFDMFICSDDITDAYRRLRRLVMDYLGICAPSPSVSDPLEQSQTGSQFLDKEATETITAGSANMGARTWSKPSIPDSTSQAVTATMRQKTMSPMPTSGRGVVEEASLRRRQSAAKEAVAGSRPSLYEQILNKAPRTVPQPVWNQTGLGDDEAADMRCYSAPAAKDNMDALPINSPDSSEDASCMSSLSNISEAHGGDEELPSGDGTPQDTSRPLQLPAEMIDPLELMSGSGSKSGSGGPMAPRGSGPVHGLYNLPNSGSRPGTAESGRLGSARHQVLPPIGQNSQPSSPLPEF